MEDFGKEFFGIDESRNHERSYSGTLLFKGHIHSGDTKFGPEKMFTLSLYLLPPLKGHLYSGERVTFSASRKVQFNFLSGDTLVLQQCLTSKRVDKFHCSLVKMAIAFKT